MASVYDIPPQELIKKIAEELEKKIEPPEWSKWTKTGVSKEKSPEKDDWWYVRAASILRKLYKNGPTGVSRLRTEYGGASKKKSRPHKFKKGSGKIIRTVLQQLEEKELVEKTDKGRKISSKGRSLLDKTAKKLKG